MIRIHVTLLLAFATLVLVPATVFAQITFDPRIDQRAQGDDCRKSGTTRARSRSTKCEPEQTATVQQELRVSIDLAELPNAQCEATSTTEYQQRNTIARVNTTISVADCTVASGELTAIARIRDANDEVKSLEFPETWQRSDDQNVKLAADYPIGENVDLVNVRVRGLSCTCADAPPDAVADAPPD